MRDEPGRRGYRRRDFVRLVGGAAAAAGAAAVLVATTAADRRGGDGRGSGAWLDDVRPPDCDSGTTSFWTTNQVVGAKPRYTHVLGSVENLTLTQSVRWIACDLEPGRTYRVRALTEGRAGTVDRR